MRSVFLSRLLSTVVLWAVVLWTVFSGHEFGFFALISGMGLTALWEFYRMLDNRGLPNFKITGMICGAVLFAGSFYFFHRYGQSEASNFEVVALVGLLMTVMTRQMFKGLREVEPLPTMAYTLFGLLYVVWLFNFMNKIVYVVPRNAENMVMGQFYVLYLMVVTKFSDMGAYITGSLFGKHLLIPHISPKKTWEGFFGALFFSLLGSHALVWYMPDRLSLIDTAHATVLGLLLGFAAIVGDLAESIVKRGSNVKDSGHFLPGIGGALDLIDSLLFTAPLLYFYLELLIN